MKICKMMKCETCDKPFTPSIYTAHNQTHCTEEKCLKLRRRERQKKYREKKKQELRWRVKQSQFVAESGKRRKERERSMASVSVGKELKRKTETGTTKAMVAGLASIIGRVKSHDKLIAFLAEMEMKGRKLLNAAVKAQH